MGPRGDLELIVIWFCLVFFVIYLAIIFGKISMLVEECMWKRTALQEKIDVGNSVLGLMKIEPSLQKDIRIDILAHHVPKLEQ